MPTLNILSENYSISTVLDKSKRDNACGEVPMRSKKQKKKHRKKKDFPVSTVLFRMKNGEQENIIICTCVLSEKNKFSIVGNNAFIISTKC